MSQKKAFKCYSQITFFSLPKWCINLFGFLSCFLVVLSPFRDKKRVEKRNFHFPIVVSPFFIVLLAFQLVVLQILSFFLSFR